MRAPWDPSPPSPPKPPLLTHHTWGSGFSLDRGTHGQPITVGAVGKKTKYFGDPLGQDHTTAKQGGGDESRGAGAGETR